jgi:cytochrome c553
VTLAGLGAALCCSWAQAAADTAKPADAALVAAGKRIYMDGILPSGAALVGVRFGNVQVSGDKAACVQCHKRSGMGGVEGDVRVAPIASNYLFNPPDKTQLANMDPRVSKSFNMTHPPYDDATLARAVRTGLNVGGASMHDMMPRYELDDAAMAALAAYLHQLTRDWSVGAGDQIIRLATIIAPDVEPARRQVVLDMLRTAVLQKNANTIVGRQYGGRRHMAGAAELVLGTERKWELDVWELKGEPATWQAQLDTFYRAKPVFAVLSGVGNGTWAPVHAFCEAQALPCWFPAVDMPQADASDYYSIYFSRGVLLEADVLAQHLRGAGKAKQVVQIFRDDDVGRGASAALTKALAGSGIAVQSQAVRPADASALQQALAQVSADATLVLWLRAEDTRQLGAVINNKQVFFSAQMLTGPQDVPSAWKARSKLVYPYELPQKRALSLSYFHQWLRLRKLPLVDEPLQSKVFFAASFLTDTTVEMLENLYRDYLLERAEMMINRREGSKAQDEAHTRQLRRRSTQTMLKAAKMGNGAETPQDSPKMADEPIEMLGERESTTVYPRLTLATGQRFASKGAYIVRFADTNSNTLIAESEWIVP